MRTHLSFNVCPCYLHDFRRPNQMKSLEWPKDSHIIGLCFLLLLFFLTRSRAANSAVSGQIRPNFGLIREFMIFLMKNEEDPIKTGGARVLLPFQVFNGSYHFNKWWNLVEIVTVHPTFYACPHYLQVIKDFKSMGNFSDAQGQLTPHSVVSNSSMSSLPASIKRIG